MVNGGNNDGKPNNDTSGSRTAKTTEPANRKLDGNVHETAQFPLVRERPELLYAP
ncbi:hypothetical protein D3C73_1563070 [compost metagenome]